MRNLWVLLAVFALSPLVAANHPPCVPEEQDPATYEVVFAPDGMVYYILHQEVTIHIPPKVPESTVVLDQPTVYFESNGIFDWPDGSLQRGGIGLLGDWFPPGCDQEWGPLVNTTTPSIHPENLPEGTPCLIINEDPIVHDNCGHGVDSIVL